MPDVFRDHCGSSSDGKAFMVPGTVMVTAPPDAG
jgi:hypothetical protein